MDQNEGNQGRILVIFIFTGLKHYDYHQKKDPGEVPIGKKYKENTTIFNWLLLSD